LRYVSNPLIELSRKTTVPLLNEAGEKINLTDYTWQELDRLPRKAELRFLLPLGATEEHGYHLPLGTDTFQAVRLAELAARRVPGTIVLPAMSYGHCLDTMNYCGTLTASAGTICSLVLDIVQNLHRHAFRKLVIVNGHGGNKGVAESALREALLSLSPPGQPFSADFSVYLISPYEKIGPQLKKMLDGKDFGHACEMETSVMLALAPEMVKLELAKEEYMSGGPDTLWRIRDMRTVSAGGVHGAPNKATRAKGEKILEMLVAGLADFLGQI